MRQRTKHLCLVVAAVMLPGCAKRGEISVEQISDGKPVPGYALRSLTGFRNGETLHAQASFAGGGATLTLELQFRIGVPTRLESGSYAWDRGDQILHGPAREVSCTFLGGQSGPPSIGGTFELLSPQGDRLYRVRIPVSELTVRR